jgi:hypothetical protein
MSRSRNRRWHMMRNSNPLDQIDEDIVG